MTSRKMWLLAGCGILLLCLCGQKTHAQILEIRSSEVVADVVDAKGEEDFIPIEADDWRRVVLGQDLSAGDLLRTGPYGGLGIAFSDRTYVRLHANTRMSVADPGDAGGPRRLQLEQGGLWSRASRPDAGVIVTTPTATAAVRGTDWFMQVEPDGTSRLVVLDGEVRFYNNLGEVAVGAGTSAIARPGQAPEFELLVISDDRPRWSLTPRSDWITYLPFARARADATGDMTPVWAAIEAGQPRRAQSALQAGGEGPSAEAALAEALIALMRRDAAGADEILSSPNVANLPERAAPLRAAAQIGAAIDLADFSTALDEITSYERSFGQDLTSLALQAYLEAYAGRYGPARDLADRAKAAAPDDWRGQLLVAQIATLQGDDAAVAANSAAAIEKAPNSATAWHWRGIYLASAGGAAPSEVEAVFQRAAELNPEAVSSIVAIAQLQSLRGRPDAALETYDAALAIDPQEPFAVAGKALVHLTMDRLDLADRTLGALAGTDGALHPEFEAALAVRNLMAGKADLASRSTGRVIAANPDRTGAAQIDAIAHWQAGRRNVAMDVIENAVRLDPNDPVSARIASAMAQDQYRAGAAVDFARASWDARRRNEAAGLIRLPASQSGRIDIGGAFQYAGLPAQGAFYTSLARNQADANSAFGLAQLYPDGLARQSGVSQGLLLDPLSVTYPNRFATFFREPHKQQTIDVSAAGGSDGAMRYQLVSDTQALLRTPRQPIALAGYIAATKDKGPLDNDTDNALLVSLRGGTVRDGKHGLIGRLTIDHRERELPGSFGVWDRDDSEETTNAVLGLGYTYSDSFSNKWMFRVTGGTAERTFANPGAFGSDLSSVDYSLAVSLGLDAARAFAARNFFDTEFSVENELILAVDPPADLPVTDRVGEALLDPLLDLDPVSRIDADIALLSLQSRRIFSHNGASYSFGLEYGLTDGETRRRELALLITGAGAVVDFANDAAISTFDFGSAAPLVTTFDSRSSVWQAHMLGTWEPRPGLVMEAGLFPTMLESRFSVNLLPGETSDDETSIDPRAGIALRGKSGQARLALQRTRLLPGVDTIAPLGTLGLLPTADLGITAERTDSAILRLEQEVTDRVFLHGTVEVQDIENVSAGLEGERLDQSTFFASSASLARVEVGADIRINERLSVSGRYARNDGELDGGLFDGADLPVVPEQTASIGATWVDPGFFRASASIAHIGERFADSANQIELDAAVVLSAGFAIESGSKTWQFRVDAQAVSSDDAPGSTGQPALDNRLTLGLSRRW